MNEKIRVYVFKLMRSNSEIIVAHFQNYSSYGLDYSVKILIIVPSFQNIISNYETTASLPLPPVEVSAVVRIPGM